MRFPLRACPGLALAAGISLASAAAADLIVREGFAPRFEQEGAAVEAALAAPDGRFYIAGEFAAIDGSARSRVARFNADGTLDTSFSPAPVNDGTVRALALDSSGRLLLTGTFSSVGGVSRSGIARLDTSGALDLTFDPADGTWQDLILGQLQHLLDRGDGEGLEALFRRSQSAKQRWPWKE